MAYSNDISLRDYFKSRKVVFDFEEVSEQQHVRNMLERYWQQKRRPNFEIRTPDTDAGERPVFRRHGWLDEDGR